MDRNIEYFAFKIYSDHFYQEFDPEGSAWSDSRSGFVQNVTRINNSTGRIIELNRTIGKFAVTNRFVLISKIVPSRPVSATFSLAQFSRGKRPKRPAENCLGGPQSIDIHNFFRFLVAHLLYKWVSYPSNIAKSGAERCLSVCVCVFFFKQNLLSFSEL